jgi:hypothetical protein
VDALRLIDLITAIAEINCLYGTKRPARLTADAAAIYVIELALPGLFCFGKQAFGVQKERRRSRHGTHKHKFSSGYAQMFLNHGRFFLFFSSGVGICHCAVTTTGCLCASLYRTALLYASPTATCFVRDEAVPFLILAIPSQIRRRSALSSRVTSRRAQMGHHASPHAKSVNLEPLSLRS